MIDLLPSNLGKWQYVESVARNHFRNSAIEEIRTPILESTYLFERGIGEGTDVVGKEMYTFLDKGDRSCTLRPEGTASVARAISHSGLISQGSQRLWYSGPMFRYERPQAGRQRQFHQLGVEFFGLPSVESDSEIISLALDLLYDLGIDDLSLQINTLGTIEDRMNYRKILVSWLEDRFDSLDRESQDRLKINPLRILDTKNPNTKKILLNAPLLKDSLCQESITRFEALKDSLNSLQIPFIINNELVRGLDYYCHTAFEITSSKLGAQSTVCGGGRYDGLIKQLGGPDTPAIGWAIGLERLMMLISDDKDYSKKLDIYIVNKGQKSTLQSLVIARELRSQNFSVEIDYSGSSFSKQFKRANKSKANWVITLGDDELREKCFLLKKLRDKGKNDTEQKCSFDNLNQTINFLRKQTS